jgi:hypothetical protein
LESGRVRRPYSGVGLALDLAAELGRQLAFAGREHRGLLVDRDPVLPEDVGPSKGAGERAEAIADRGRDRQLLALEPRAHPGQHIGEATWARLRRVVEPGHRVGCGGARVERIDDRLRVGAVRQVRSLHQEIARGIDGGGVLVPFGHCCLALAGRFDDAGAGAEQAPIVDAAGDGR